MGSGHQGPCSLLPTPPLSSGHGPGGLCWHGVALHATKPGRNPTGPVPAEFTSVSRQRAPEGSRLSRRVPPSEGQLAPRTCGRPDGCWWTGCGGPGRRPAGLTCDVDAAVQSGQRETPLVVVGKVGERRPPLWRGEGGQRRARCWAPQPAAPLLPGGCCPFASGRGGWGTGMLRAGAAPWGRVGGGPGCPEHTAAPATMALRAGTQTGHRIAPGGLRGRPGLEAAPPGRPCRQPRAPGMVPPRSGG